MKENVENQSIKAVMKSSYSQGSRTATWLVRTDIEDLCKIISNTSAGRGRYSADDFVE